MLTIINLQGFDSSKAIPVYHGTNKINAKAIAMLEKWCMIVGKGNEVSFVEKFFHDTYQGQYSLVGNTAVHGHKNNFDSEEYEKFKQEVEKLALKRHDFNEKDSKIVPISAIN